MTVPTREELKERRRKQAAAREAAKPRSAPVPKYLKPEYEHDFQDNKVSKGFTIAVVVAVPLMAFFLYALLSGFFQ